MKTKTIILVGMLFTSTLCLAQFDGAPIDFFDNVNDETPAAPIDGLVGLALIAGAFYGAKKINKKK